MKKTINKGIKLFLFVLLLSIVAAILQNFNVNKTFILVFVSISALSFYSILSLGNIGFFLKKSDSSKVLRRVVSAQFFQEIPQVTTALLEEADKAIWDLIEAVEPHKSTEDKELSIGNTADESLNLDLSEPSRAFVII